MWFLPWVLAAVVGIGALWIGIDAALGSDATSPAEEPPAGSAVTEPTATPTDQSSKKPGPQSSPSPTKKPEEKEEEAKKPPEKEKPEPRLISKGVPVQVLNGTVDSGAGDRMAGRLEKLGFEIVAVNIWEMTPESVVYWATPKDQKAATLLADRLGWQVQPKPADLSTEVRLHVLVGADEVTD
jgi:LytR cell envelope-related transcriptional attenuator